jgi:glutathione S-transferase
MAAFLNYYMMIGLMEKNPVFVAYADRHVQRPAALAANARDDALVPAHPHPSQATATTEAE